MTNSIVKVRFNLGAGPRYKKWKVEWPTGEVKYLEPAAVSLVMTGCRLSNRPGSAQKIFDGHQKFVCAWIECDSVEITEPIPIAGPILSYNPRVSPHWLLNGADVDGTRYETLATYDRIVFIAAKPIL